MPYFDYNAAAPLSSAAEAAWLAAAKSFWANPSALYGKSAQSYAALEAARAWVAEQLGCMADRIVFTSGATESAHSAFAVLARRDATHQAWVALSALEHPCVKAAAGRYFPGRILELVVDNRGVLCLESLNRALSVKPLALVAVMAASNEVGTLQPWKEARVLCSSKRTPLFVDAVQWVGRLPSGELGDCDFVGFGAHKLGGPRGIGVLKIPASVEGPLLLDGGGQEQDRRAGTENIAGILAFVAAWQALESVREKAALQQAAYRDQFVEALKASMPGLCLLGEGAPRLWNTATLLMPAYAGPRWVKRLDKRGFEVGIGSACSSRSGELSALAALGLDHDKTQHIVRVSGGPSTTHADWVALANAFKAVWQELNG